VIVFISDVQRAEEFFFADNETIHDEEENLLQLDAS
jgi:hypothetical protein